MTGRDDGEGASVTPLVLVSQEGAVRTLTFNRPEQRNAWSDELNVAYADALRSADVDPSVRAIVIGAAGPHFCVGGDMGDLKTFASEKSFRREGVRRAEPWETTTIRKPVIAAVQGACAGIGFAHVLTCDVRFAAADARFATSYARRGLPAESGMAWLLPRLVGAARAADLLLSGRLVQVDEAFEMGLVTAVVRDEPVLNAAVRYAQDLATNCSPTAMLAIKQQIWSGLASGPNDFRDSARAADLLAESALASPDVLEGVASFVEKRSPQFVSFD